MSLRLKDRIAIITGSSSGIGRATAFRFAREGAKVVCADLREGSWRETQGKDAYGAADRLDEADGLTHERIIRDGGEAIFVKVDVSDPKSVEALVKTAVEKYGRLDVMVNNAGFAFESENPLPVWEVSLETFDKTLAVNLKGVFYGIKYASAHMVTQEPLANGDRGVILNAASIFGLVGGPMVASYASSKGGVANLTRAAAIDCAAYNIRVNAVNPGFIETFMTDRLIADEEGRNALLAMHPYKGVGRPDDVAKAYVFLASDDASWTCGVNLPIDGGYVAR